MNQGNPLGYEKISKLLKGFAIPSIVAMLVSSLYNIVDQIFIGHGVGYLGNAATNVSYPLTTICLAIALLIGVGSAARFSLHLGRKEEEEAARIVGNGVFLIHNKSNFEIIHPSSRTNHTKQKESCPFFRSSSPYYIYGVYTT